MFQRFGAHKLTITIIVNLLVYLVSLVDTCVAIMNWHSCRVVGSTMLPCGYALHIVAISELVH